MMITLTELEMKQAIKEWCENRGISITVDNITIEHNKTADHFFTQIRGVNPPTTIKGNGPYR